MKYLSFLLICIASFFSTHGEYSRNKVLYVHYDPKIKDYGPFIKASLDSITWDGGGVLKLEYGQYPVLSPIVMEILSPVVQNMHLTIEGVPDSKGNLPTLFDSNKRSTPHIFFWIAGNWYLPDIAITMRKFNISGNDYPFSPQSFYLRKDAMQSPAIRLSNIGTALIESMTIKDVYGDGIGLMNGYSENNDKKHRIESPVIRNCKILNCWSWNGKDNGGDGIMLWSVNNALVENCIIYNDIKNTHSYSRVGIVLEHNTEGAVIKNNTICGYQRNMHIEGTYGGHIIQNNSFLQSSVAITLNEISMENGPGVYKPIIIRNNTMSYTNADDPSKINRPFNDWSFISGNMKGKALPPVNIEDNKFTYYSNKKLSAKITLNQNVPDNIFLYFRNSDGYDKVEQKGNAFLIK